MREIKVKRYRYVSEITMGNISTQETEEAKKSMASFLKAYQLNQKIEKHKYDVPEVCPHYYSVHVMLSDSNLLRVLQFADSLRNFCLYWYMELHEYGMFEDEEIIQAP